MKFLSHRGNLKDKIPLLENQPDYIDEALSLGLDVEIDIWVDQLDTIWLGHDRADYQIDINWLIDRSSNLWIHCKNITALQYFNSLELLDFNYFFHDTDLATLTSKGFIWAYPGNQPIKGSIAVLPEMYGDDVSECYGICSDKILLYK